MDSLLEIALSNAILATALAVVVFSISRFLRQPALCHALWVLVLVKLVTPPIVSVPVPTGWGLVRATREIEVAPEPKAIEPAPVEAYADEPDAFAPAEDSLGVGFQPETRNPAASMSAAASTSQTEVSSVVETSSFHVLRNVLPVLLGVWLVGTALALMTTVLRIYWFHRTLRMTKRASADLQDEVRELADRIGIRRCPGACLVSATVGPMLWAVWGKPKILFPAKLCRDLSPESRRTLLLHELAHLRRRDHWVRILEAVVTISYWWHPVVWWARREIRPLEEACCDSWVVSEMPDNRNTYAVALVEAIRFLSGSRPFSPPATSGIGSFVSVKRRVTMIMQGEHSRSLSGAGRLILIATAAVFLPLLPVLAQRGKTPPDSPESTAADVGGASPQAKSGAKAVTDDPSADAEARVRERNAIKRARMHASRASLVKPKHNEPNVDGVILEGSLCLLHYITGPREPRGSDPFAKDSRRRYCDYYEVADLLQRLAHHSWRRLSEESPREMLVRLQKEVDTGSNPEVLRLRKCETEFRAANSDPWPFDWREKQRVWLDLVELVLLTKDGADVKVRWRGSMAAADARYHRLYRIAYLMAVRSARGSKLDHEYVRPLVDDAELVTHRIFFQAEILRTLQILGAPVNDPARSEARTALLVHLRENPRDVRLEGIYDVIRVLPEVYKLGDERLERGPLLKTLVQGLDPYLFSYFARRAQLSEVKVRQLFLGKRVSIECDNTPVATVVQDLASEVYLRIWIDEKVLAEERTLSVLPIQGGWLDVMQSVLNQTPYRLHVLLPDLYWIGRPEDWQAANAMLAESLSKIPPGGLKIPEQLRMDTRWEFVDTPLERVAEFLSDMHGINVFLLDGHESRVTINLRILPLHVALTVMGDENDCDWHAAKESLAIGSRERIKEFAKLEWKHMQRAARLTRLRPKVPETLEQLEHDTRFEFPGSPLTDVAKSVERIHCIEVTLAPGCQDLRVKSNIKGQSLGWALDQTLFLVDLTWDTDGEQIYIGTEAQVAEFVEQAKKRAGSDER